MGGKIPKFSKKSLLAWQELLSNYWIIFSEVILMVSLYDTVWTCHNLKSLFSTPRHLGCFLTNILIIKYCTDLWLFLWDKIFSNRTSETGDMQNFKVWGIHWQFPIQMWHYLEISHGGCNWLRQGHTGWSSWAQIQHDCYPHEKGETHTCQEHPELLGATIARVVRGSTALAVIREDTHCTEKLPWFCNSGVLSDGSLGDGVWRSACFQITLMKDVEVAKHRAQVKKGHADEVMSPLGPGAGLVTTKVTNRGTDPRTG